MPEKGPVVLVVDDELAIRRLLRTTLSVAGFQVEEAAGGREALLKNGTVKPDVIILDLGLPDMDGIEVLERIREYSTVPVLILTVQDAEEDKVRALDLGADDYLTKPFGVAELMARIRAALRHSRPTETEPILVFGLVELNLEQRQVKIDGKAIKLTSTEYGLFRLLAMNAGKVLTHRMILRQIWGPAYIEETHYLRVYIAQLRKKLEVFGAPRLIHTEPGVGYRLIPPSEEETTAI